MKTIFHLDMDAFFVSVERILDPSLQGKPVIVGGDPHGRGVVAACSYEARKFGIHSAMPIANAFRLCPKGIFLHGHHKEYVRYSNAVKNLLEEKFPIVQQASIDEFYCDFTGCQKIYGEPQEFAKKLQQEIMNKFSLPCSIGISSNKSVSKIATDLNKPMGITFVPHGKEKEFLAPLAIERIPGVGKKTFPILKARGFNTIGDLANASQDYLASILGKFGIDLWNRANGFGSDILSLEHERKSISKETTFEEDIVGKTEIEVHLFKLVEKVAQLLRNENLNASTIGIKLRYSDFSTITRAKTIKEPTNDDKIIYQTAVNLFRAVYTRRVGVRLIGIHLSKLEHVSEQEVLFEDEELIRKRMLNAVTKIRDKYGSKIIHIGIVGNK
ncbi:DNA polymerase IV [Bacteroidetes/Chlorobi group bacterium ChocPot_Mid]|nr:MAG: DNA polymerase IV [Bacteroidetes/Chlorobi group bacterium ChocPot_Mid]